MILSEEQQLIRETARAFAEAEIAPNAATWDREARFPREAIDALGALGFMGMLVPNEFGGAGADHISYALALMEIAGGDGACSTIMSVHNSVGCMPILKFGSAMQKERFLKPMARGERLAAFCLSEPGAGSDAAAIRCRADRDGNHYVLRGVKQFVTSGANADIAIVFAVTDPEAGKAGISAFIVPTDTPGFEIVRSIPVMGEIHGHHGEINYKDVRVPLTNILGEAGAGFSIAQRRLGPGRIHHCMRWLGQMQRAFELMCRYSLARETFGSPLAEKQTIQNWIADSYVEIQASRLLTLRAAEKIDTGDEARVEISAIKWFGAKVLHDVIDRAIQTHGALGVSGDTPLESMYREARSARIYDGPDEVHRILIAKNILKHYHDGMSWDFGN